MGSYRAQTRKSCRHGDRRQKVRRSSPRPNPSPCQWQRGSPRPAGSEPKATKLAQSKSPPAVKETKAAKAKGKPETKDAKLAKSGKPETKGGKVAKAEPKPAKAESKFHVVKPQETLYRVATLNGISVAELRRLNKMGPKDNSIRPGQKLKVDI